MDLKKILTYGLSIIQYQILKKGSGLIKKMFYTDHGFVELLNFFF